MTPKDLAIEELTRCVRLDALPHDLRRQDSDRVYLVSLPTIRLALEALRG